MSTEAEILGERIAEMAAHLDAATHGLLTALRDYDRSNNWYAQGFASCATWLSWRVGMSAGTARDHLRVANRLADLPLIDDALRTGSISYSKVRAMTRVATSANEAMLLEDARHSTGSQLETICRKYATVVRAAKEVDEKYDHERRTVTRRDLEDGMVRIEATLHPEEAALVWAALDQIARERALRVQLAAQMGIEVDARGLPSGAQDSTPRMSSNERMGVQDTTAPVSSLGSVAHVTSQAAERVPSQESKAPVAFSPDQAPPCGQFNRADGLVAMAQSVVRGEAQRRSPVELVVTLAAEVLCSVSAESFGVAVFADGTCVSAETARRLACDCGVVHMTEDEHGNALTVGRKTRSIPSAIKRALDKRDPCCRFPGCTNRLYVEGHHIRHWANGGETSLSNLVNICSLHHRFVHEYSYRVELDDAQQPRFFDRHGRAVQDVPERPWRERIGMEVIVEQNAALEIEAETNVCLWDGDRIQYGDVIDALVRRDGLS